MYAEVFAAISTVNIDEIERLSEDQIRLLLPTLVRISFAPSFDTSENWLTKKRQIIKLISPFEEVNVLVGLLTTDFHSLDAEVKKEQQMRSKMGANPNDTYLLVNNMENISLEFERSEGVRRLKIVLNELLATQSFIKQAYQTAKKQPDCLRYSQIFDNIVYLDEVADALCICMAELQNTLFLNDVVETLLFVKHGPELICRLVINSPENFHEVCISLLMNADKLDEDSLFGKRRIEVIRKLCEMNPTYTLVVRGEAIESCRMPGLCILLTVDSIHQNSHTDRIQDINDLIAFVNGIFINSDDKVRSCYVQYVRNCQKRTDLGNVTNLALLRQELLACINFILEENAENTLTNHIVVASSLLRMYCALRVVASMKFNEVEVKSLLELITRRPAPTAAGIRFASVGLCFLLACAPTFIGSNPANSEKKLSEAEKKVVEWIKWLVEDESLFGQVAGVRSSLGEMLLLIAIHFHSTQNNAIADLISTTLGIKIASRPTSIMRMKSIFTQEIFTDSVVTAHAVKVAVTPNLSSDIQGFLPVHCIFHLLRSRAFTKHKVPIKNWIYKQICCSIAPLHQVLPNLIDAYVNSVIIPYSKTLIAEVNEPISEDEILAVFKHKIYSVDDQDEPMDSDDVPKCILTTQLLLLYYILLYEDVRLNRLRMSQRSSSASFERLAHAPIKKYSSAMFAQLPIFHLMQQAKNEPTKYGLIFPRLLRLISTHYPHLCLIKDWFAAEKIPSMKNVKISITEERERLQFAMQHIHEPKVSGPILDRIWNLPNRCVWPLASCFVENLPLLLKKKVDGVMMKKVKKLWWKLNCIFPENLSVLTVNALKCHSFDNRKLSWADTVTDPLHVLRCDERVFRCTEILEIVLHILQGFLIASRTHFSHHLLEKTSATQEQDKDREELMVALITAQESAAIQILLECCLPGPGESIEDEKLTKVRTLIGVHLHQVFIADPNLCKYVHFLGYPSELIPFTVSSIPSMHICLEFIPELLAQPELQKQIFAIDLCSYLCVQYPVVKSLCVAKLCFSVSTTLLNILESAKRDEFFIAVIPALVRMCKPFPPLTEETTNLLVKLGQISLSRLSFLPDAISCKPVIQKFPIDEISKVEAKDFLYSLPKYDLLCRTIHESLPNLLSNDT